MIRNILLKRYILFFLVFLFLQSFYVKAQQIKSFTEDNIVFIKEVTDFFEAVDKKSGRDYMEEYTLFWNSDRLTDDDKKFIYKVCNGMLKKRLKAFPDFQNFLSSMHNFTKSGNQSEASYIAWKKTLEKIMNGKSTPKFQTFLAMSNNLFTDNTIFKSATTRWRTDNNNYTFEYDTIPRVVFLSNLRLVCYSKNDSMWINETKGVFYPTLEKWVGTGGKVDWKRAGLDDNSNYAELKKYNIMFKSSQYIADSVLYYNKIYFERPLLGRLTDKVLTGVNEEGFTYPQFDSYSKRFQLKNIYEDVDYDGGFSVKGAKVIGSGDSENPAMVKFYRNKKLFMLAKSKSFIIRTDRISSDRAAIAIYYDKDSIYHPGLQMKFIFKEKELTLIRDEQGIARSPYYDSYHKVDMYFEVLLWKLDQPKIDFRTMQGSSQSEAVFESSNYFRGIRYEKIQGLDDVHPFLKIRDYSKKMGGSKELDVEGLSKNMKLSPDQVRPLLMKFATAGFVNFNIGEDKIILKDRLTDYIANNFGKKDYDVIEFKSILSGSQNNAQINLLNFDLKIFGIDKIYLSDSQSVYINPKEGQIIMKQNRDFAFAGVIHAGRFDFYGKEFSFEYDAFKLNLVNTDSLRIKVKSRDVDENGNAPLVSVKTVIENVNGNLIIDNPVNKSGRANYPEYPIFNCLKDSYAYWDKKKIQGGVYTRDKVGFHLQPFIVDSLDNFTNEALAFKGEFSSGGIFPDFDEILRLQEDYSLGFKRNTGPDGIVTYGTKGGKFTNQIRMSNQGLRGDGDLEYITSLTKSKDFIFYPDSMNTVAQSFHNKRTAGQIEFPSVKGDSVYVHWMPNSEYMNTSKIRKALVFFEGKAELNGTSVLTPNGMLGRGRMDFLDAELESSNMHFKQMIIDADTADFRLKSLNTDISAIAFDTKNMNAHVDFDKREGKFKSNGGGDYVKFPVNQYIAFMDEFTWFIDKAVIELSASNKINVNAPANEDLADLQLSGSEFISVHPKQDSLRFYSPSARYDLKNHIIHCKDVKYINVADARLYPDNGKVVIYKKAELETFKNSKILANVVTKYHSLYKVTASIFGRKNYSGAGYYDYIDELKGRQQLFFPTIVSDTTGQTIAKGVISDSLKFTLSPNFDYKGKVTLIASNEYLAFDGACRIQHPCEKLGISWIKFEGEVDPENIFIPIAKDLKSDVNEKVFAGMMVTNDSAHVYSSFLSRKMSYSDQEVLVADGFLYFDKRSREYQISNKDKLREINSPGNLLGLNSASCIVYGEGKLDFANTTLGQVKLKAVGNGSHNLINDSIYFDVVLALDFFFENSCLKMMTEKFESATALKGVNLNRPTYERSLREMIGKEEADKLISQLNLYGSFKRFPNELEHTLLLTDVKMKWNTETKSYVSVGDIGIGSINKNQLNKMVKGRIELIKKRSGDILNIYLSVDDNNWYYFNYQTGLMQALSSDEKFNTAIKELKPDKRKMEKEKGQAAYQFNLSTVRKKTDFIRKFETN